MKLTVPLDRAKLDSGELQVFEFSMNATGDAVKKRAVGVIVIDAPVEKVWDVLKDWDAMGSFIPGLEYYKTIHASAPRTENAVGVSIIEGSLTIAFIGLLYTLRVTFDRKNLTQEWRLVTGEDVSALAAAGIPVKKTSPLLKSIEGFEYLEPYAGGKKTLYYYAPVVEAAGIPAWAEKRIAKSSLSEYMLAVRKRVMSLR